jgi:His/Glu/Gln/Arg/opine family amino acid ABC transporter permease subunit
MSALAPYAGYLVLGAVFTVLLAVVSFPLSVGFGLVLAHARVGRAAAARRAAAAFVSVFRSLPELLVMLLTFYGLNVALRAAGEGLGLAVPAASPFVAAIVALTLQFGAYSAEILRDAHGSIRPGLAEAGRAIGFSEAQVRARILTPLMMRAAMPALGNLFLVLLKVSALASAIGVDELTRRTNIVSGAIKDPFLCFGVAALGYLLITGAASLVQELVVERRFRKEGGAHAR